MAILDTQVASAEIVITERIATTEYKIREIHEDIQNRRVRATVDLGPFIPPTGPLDTERASGSRYLLVWENDEYDTVRDTWTNADLIARVQVLMA
jgi:hypothetical protein